MNLPRSLVAGTAAAILATGALALVLETATRPEAPKRAPAPVALPPAPAPLVPRPVRTEAIRPPTLPSSPLVERAPEAPEAAPPRAEVPKAAPPRDLCSRHGLRKIVTRGGRSWRCRRP